MTADPKLVPEAGGGRLPNVSGNSHLRVVARVRAVGAALVLVMVAVSVFAVWSSQATSNETRRAAVAHDVSDDYGSAASALSAEESLEREYRLEPGPAVRAAFDGATAELVDALTRISRDGNTADRAWVGQVLGTHDGYLSQTDLLFRAVDLGDRDGVLRADKDTEVTWNAIEQAVGGAAEAENERSLVARAHLQHMVALTRWLTPVVFLAGLLLAAGLTVINRRHRRSLDIERARAVHASLHDALTGLPNRLLLADRFDQALRADHRAGTSTGLLLLDLDHFKEINDTYGHHYGDEVLSQVGSRLTGVLRAVDTVARLGGDEFAVLLPDVRTVADATAVAAKLTAALERPFHVDGVDLDVEASIGVVLSGEHGQDATLLLQRADIAMYVAKTQSHGVFVYDPTIDGHSPAKLALLGYLRRALDRGELILHYQPKISVSTGDVVGAEALVRWQHPERGLVFPDTFIPLAEHTGLIGPLTRHVLDTALAQARSWADAGRPLKIAVNLSARNLLDEHLADQVAELLTVHGVAAELLELEVTESAIMTEPVKAQRVLEQLSTLGVRISIDDFGAGYTSLSQLKTLPVSELKIDQSFVTTMTEDTSNALIVQSVVDLGHNLGLTIVAEGVESQPTLTALAALGCDVAQGYHLSRPITAAAFDTWYAGRHLTALHPAVTTPEATQVPRAREHRTITA